MEYVCLRFMKKQFSVSLYLMFPYPFQLRLNFYFGDIMHLNMTKVTTNFIYTMHRKSSTKERHQEVFQGLSTCVQYCTKYISHTHLWGFTYLLEVHIALIQNCMYHKFRNTGMEKSDRCCTSVHRLPCFSYTLAPYSVSDCRRGKINPFNVNMSTPLSHMHCPYCVKHYLQFSFCNIAHIRYQSHRLPIITRRYSSLQLSRFSFYTVT